MRQRLGLVVALLATAAAAGCGGGSSNIPVTSTPAPTITPTINPTQVPDDWTTYAHDYQRTGFEQTANSIKSTNVSQLALAWRVQPDPACVAAAQSAVPSMVFADEASPLVANGLVYVADVCGWVTALDRSTGNTVWQQKLPLTSGSPTSGVYGTPTIADGTLFVPMWGAAGNCAPTFPQTCASPATGGHVVALDALTGTIKWSSQPLARGNMRGEPLIVKSLVFEGVSGGDGDSGWVNGGMIALSESTGAQVASFQVAPIASSYGNYDGGGSWSPISYDGNNLYFGTGNTQAKDGFQDSVIELVPSTMAPTSFVVPTYDGDLDEDVGGGQLLWGGNIYFSGKSGYFYGFPMNATNVPLFKPVLINTYSTPSGIGGIGTPTTDGSVIAVSSGYNYGTYGSDLDVFPVGSGALKCKLSERAASIWSYAAFVKGLGFTSLDNGQPPSSAWPAFVAFDDNCNILWTAKPSDLLGFFYGGPAVVQSGVYAVDVAGDVYAWKISNAPGTQLQRRSSSLIRPGVRVHLRFGHFTRDRQPQLY
jgi:outer membrane protein assembly factor BamB